MNQSSLESDLLSTGEAARLLGISPREVRRLVQSGKLPVKVAHYRGRKVYRFLRSDLEAIGQSLPDSMGQQSGAMPDTDSQAFRDLLIRHEQTVYRLAQLETKLPLLEETVGKRDRELAELRQREQKRVEEISQLREENESLKKELARVRKPWWKRLFSRE